MVAAAAPDGSAGHAGPRHDDDRRGRGQRPHPTLRLPRAGSGEHAVDVEVGVVLAVAQGLSQVELARTHAAPPAALGSSTRNRASARAQLLLTVPTGTSSAAAVSCSDRSQ